MYRLELQMSNDAVDATRAELKEVLAVLADRMQTTRTETPSLAYVTLRTMLKKLDDHAEKVRRVENVARIMERDRDTVRGRRRIHRSRKA